MEVLATSLMVFSLAGIIAAPIMGALTAGFGPAVMGVVADIAPGDERASWIGIKGTVGSLGSLSGPALVILIIQFIPPQSVFLVSATLILFTSPLVPVALRLPTRAETARDLPWEVSQEPIMAAHSALQSLVRQL